MFIAGTLEEIPQQVDGSRLLFLFVEPKRD